MPSELNLDKTGAIMQADGHTIAFGFATIHIDQLPRAVMYGWIGVGNIIGTENVTIQRQRSFIRFGEPRGEI